MDVGSDEERSKTAEEEEKDEEEARVANIIDSR